VIDHSKVSLIGCADYDFPRVEAAIRRALDLLGGMSAFVKPGQRVLLKPNLVRAVPPERAVTTHPTIVATVAKLVVEVGASPIIVESPGGPYSRRLLKGTYRKTGMTWAAKVGGAELNYDVGAIQVSHPEGVVLHGLDLVAPLVETDAVINLAKLKTHNLTMLTLAVKNLFGLVPGPLKIGYHARFKQAERFAQGLVDIVTYVKPVLNLVDGIIAMEGNGPSGGDPRQIGAIVVGADAFAVDVVSSALVGFDPLEVPTTRAAMERGLTTGRLADITLVGDAIDSLRVTNFRKGMASPIDPGLLPWWLRSIAEGSDTAQSEEGSSAKKNRLKVLAANWVWRQLAVVPRAGEKCTGCGYCVKHCPVGAIQVVDGKARMDTHKCIHCYCCHELCPNQAVELRRPFLGRLVAGS